jgi:hypothetical protein
MDAVASSDAIPTVTVTAQAPSHETSHFWAGSSFSFHDLLDVINPLQHIPIVAPIYRAITGDKIGNVARIVGDGLYGGPLGAASGALDVAVKEVTGKDIGENVIDLVEGKSDKDVPATPAAAAHAGLGVTESASTPSGAYGRLAGAAGPAGLSSSGAGTPNPNVPVNLPFFPQASPQLPSFGNSTTSGMLAAAAPVTPLDVAEAQRNQGPSSQAQTEATPQPEAPLSLKPLGGSSSFIPIDTSQAGIMKMKAVSAVHNTAPVPLELPAGAIIPKTAAASSPPIDFSAKMREGLDKYNALLTQKAKQSKENAVNTSS